MENAGLAELNPIMGRNCTMQGLFPVMALLRLQSYKTPAFEWQEKELIETAQAVLAKKG